MCDGDGELTTEEYGPLVEPPSSYRPKYIICRRGETWWVLHRPQTVPKASLIGMPMPVGPFTRLDGALDRIRDLRAAELAAEG